MRQFSLLLTLLASIIFLACRKEDGQDTCTTTGCTEEFWTVSVQLIRAGSTPPTIDSVQTTDEHGTPLRSSTGRPVYGLGEPVPGGKVYAGIVDDTWVKGNKNREIPVTFRGFRNGIIVFQEGYTIGADCCHIYKAEGPKEITVPD